MELTSKAKKILAYSGVAVAALAIILAMYFNGSFDQLAHNFERDFIKYDRYEFVVTGIKNTLIITLCALVIGFLLGTIAAVVRSVHDLNGNLSVLNAIFKVYITVIRGTPVLVQLLIIYYVIFASVNINSILVASIAFGINSGAYVAESIRAGINAVPRGQLEAATSLGMPFYMAMITVILPQAFRNILPALGNEGISLLKETSVAGYIGVIDLTRAGDLIRAQTYDAMLPLIVIALIYLCIVLVLQRLLGMMERRLNRAY